MYEPLHDEVLGSLTWDDALEEWSFGVTLASGREVAGGITPNDPALPPQDRGLAEVARLVGWIRENEFDIRRHIAEKMFDNWYEGWYEDEIDTVDTQDGFRDAITLSRINIHEEGGASLYYDDGELFSGHIIILSVAADGTLDASPTIAG